MYTSFTSTEYLWHTRESFFSWQTAYWWVAILLLTRIDTSTTFLAVAINYLHTCVDLHNRQFINNRMLLLKTPDKLVINDNTCHIPNIPFSPKQDKWTTVYAIYFAGGFIFANFASRVLFANLTTRENIYLRSGPTHECDLCTQLYSSTVHSARAREDRYFCLLKMSDCSPRSQI